MLYGVKNLEDGSMLGRMIKTRARAVARCHKHPMAVVINNHNQVEEISKKLLNTHGLADMINAQPSKRL